jgi:hypothetical protein
MNEFETYARVEGGGEIHLAGLPFAPGAEVRIVVSAAQDADAGADQVAALMLALDQAHNTQPVGPLRRKALYDRNGLR